MKKIQITLSVEESKDLIARTILFHPLFKHSQENGSIILKGGTTVSKISENLLGFPLRICGRVTERGTVSVGRDSSAPHTVLVRKEEWRNIDEDLVDETSSLGCDDLIVCSANAIDSKGNAVLMAGSTGGGDTGKAISNWYTEGVKVIIPVGIEKLVPGDLNEAIKRTSRKGIDFSTGMAVGLIPLIGELFTEIEAFKTIGDVEVFPMGAGGIYGAQGSAVFQIEGENREIDRIIDLVKDIKNSKTNVSGDTLSLIECSYPSYRCQYHVGCSYKSGEIKDIKSKKIGILTIGQSPRVDFTRDIIPILSKEYQIIEKGALDEYDYDEAHEKFSPTSGDEILVSRMRDGQQIEIAEKHIVPLIQDAVTKLENMKCGIILLMCTGKFPEIKHKSLLIKPQEIIPKIIKKLTVNKKLGLIIPDKAQINQMYEWWDCDRENMSVAVASPYKGNEELIAAAKLMNDEKVDLIFMDCMGYTMEMKEIIEKETDKTVMLPRTLAIRIINEL